MAEGVETPPRASSPEARDRALLAELRATLVRENMHRRATARILAEYRVPATIFLATRWIDEGEFLPHDRVRLIRMWRAADEFAYGDEMRELARLGRLRLLETVTRSGTADWAGTRGRITRAQIASQIRSTNESTMR